MKIAEHHLREKNPYQPKCAWDDNTLVQWGSWSMHINREDGTVTPGHAFFEAFPHNKIHYYIRGEGATIEAAELDCWQWEEKINDGHVHEYEARGRYDGYGFCKICNVGVSGALPITSKCKKCGKNAAWAKVSDKPKDKGLCYCRECDPRVKRIDDIRLVNIIKRVVALIHMGRYGDTIKRYSSIGITSDIKELEDEGVFGKQICRVLIIGDDKERSKLKEMKEDVLPLKMPRDFNWEQFELWIELGEDHGEQTQKYVQIRYRKKEKDSFDRIFGFKIHLSLKFRIKSMFRRIVYFFRRKKQNK